VRGWLTIGATTRPVDLDVTVGEGADGAISVRAEGRISRRAFGLDWAALREAGRLVVSDRVELRLELVARPR